MVNSSILNNANLKEIASKGNFHVWEHERDLSVSAISAVDYYFASKMNVRKRQLMLDLNNNSYIVQAGAMQWMSGNVSTATNVKGVGDFLGKMVSSAVTSESAVKPIYQGVGRMMLEPTYRYIILLDVSEWGSVVLDDGLFLACDGNLTQRTVARKNLSSAVFGGEGLFNLSLSGSGIAALESNVPYEELIEVVNNSVRITLFRSILTTLTTILPVICLMVWGAREIVNFRQIFRKETVDLPAASWYHYPCDIWEASRSQD